MEKKTILAFDLSTACVGVVAGIVDGKVPLVVKSCPIIPPAYSPEVLGYKKSKKKLPTPKSGEFLNTYYKAGEVSITKQEKKKRDAEVRAKKDIYVLDYIGKQISNIITTIKPNVIVVEKNEIFNGVLTSVLLGKVMGVLLGIAAANNIPVFDFKVKVVRGILPVVDIVKNYAQTLTKEQADKIPDMTKRALRVHMEALYGKHGLSCKTDDESDACVVWHYYYETFIKNNFTGRV